MGSGHNDVSGREQLLDEVVTAYLKDVEAGRVPDRQALLAGHPDLATELAQFFADQDALGVLAAPRRPWPVGTQTPAGELAEPDYLGDFRIVRVVGRGGMGVVYEAEQMSLRRRVALKVLPFAATLDPRRLRRFQNEAQAAAGLHHTNIVPVYSVGCEHGVHFYAMQFIDGQPLSELIHQLRQAEKASPAAGEEQTAAYQPPPGETQAASPTIRAAGDATPLTAEGKRGRDYFRKVAELGAQAAEALDHAHQLGIVHRDVKPANLLLDGRGSLWVTDFGLAHCQSQASLTATGDLVGTLRYMSPEQVLAQRVVLDHRTDVYSLGATLYELLTLRPAFDGGDRQELLRQIAFEEPVRPRRLERAIPAELETIVLKALEKRPQDRYATAQELADDLRRWLLDQPIRARRPSLRMRLARWGRRHKSLVAGMVAALVVGLAVLAGSIGWVAHDQEARRAKNQEVVLAALEDTDYWQQRRRLPEALSSARRAHGLLAGADVDEALRQRVQARLADLELMDKLENIRLEQLTVVKDGHFDREGTDELYGRAFREAGLDVETLPADEVGDRIRRSTVAIELAAVLDHWSLIRVMNRGVDDPSWKVLLRVARAADPDPLRTRIRAALERRKHQEWLALIASGEIWDLPPTTLAMLGSVLEHGKYSHQQTEAFLREAQRRHPDDFWLNYHLYSFLNQSKPPQLDEVIRFAAVAVALRPSSPCVHYNFGNALYHKGRLDEAIAEYRAALQFKEDYVQAHTNLGTALVGKGLLDEAIAEYREAIRIKKDHASAHTNLGNVLKKKGQWDKAFAEFREAIRLKKDFLVGHINLGVACAEKGLLDEAIDEFNAAIQLKKDDAMVHMNLGATLLDKGKFNEAIAELKEAIRLKRDYTKARKYLLEAEQMAQLDNRLARILEGKAQPKDAAERIALAHLCQQPYKKRYATAMQFYSDAFAEVPKVAEDLKSQHRYNAACAAALAGCAQGKDADKLDAKERARLCQQALDWLRADLETYRQDMAKVPDKAGPVIAQRMQHWLQDTDFAGVRGAEALAKLPEAERKEWHKLWEEVEALRQHAAQPPKPAGSVRP